MFINLGKVLTIYKGIKLSNTLWRELNVQTIINFHL